jgi:integrase
MGTQTIQSTISGAPIATAGWPTRISPFLKVATILMCTIPQASASALTHSVKIFFDFLTWAGASLMAPSVELIIAFIVCRCTPPVETELPPGFPASPVLPTTATGNVDSLRRAARKGMDRIAPWLPFLESDRLAAFCSEIGGRVKRLRSKKKPFLFHHIKSVFDKSLKTPNSLTKRDAAIFVIGFFFGCRASELSKMKRSHIALLSSGSVRVTFPSRKNNQSKLGNHDASVITAQHPILTAAVRNWLECIASMGMTKEGPLFFSYRGASKGPGKPGIALSRDTFRHMVKSIDPECVAHSLRVGMATEAWAAGVPIEGIMALGGWTSPVAIMYVVGCLEETVKASQALGKAGMRYDKEGLHASLGTARLPSNTWFVKA